MNINNFFKTNTFCKSRDWDANDLEGLDLLGLTPCFEDVSLLTPMNIALIMLSIYRLKEIYMKPYRHNERFKQNAYVKIALAFGISAVNIAELFLILHPAPFEYLAYSFGAVAWFMIAVTLTKETTHFHWVGQWIHRFCFLWAFVCTCIRWKTQEALGRLPNESFYYKCYLAVFSLQAMLMCLMYFEKTISKCEYSANVKKNQVEDTKISSPGSAAKGSLSESSENSAGYKLLEDDSEPARRPSWSPYSNPERHAWLPSRLTFSWVTPLLSKGLKHTLEEDDCWPLHGNLRSEVSYKRFDQVWTTEKRDAISKNRKPSLLRAIRTALFWDFYPTVPLLILQNVCQLVLPYTLGPLIQFMQSDQPAWIGYAYSLGFFVGIFSTTLFENQFFDICTKAGVKLRGALVPLIFRHSMRLSNVARQERSVGSIVNHVSSDVEKIQMQTLSINNLWSSPMRLVLGLFILVNSLGWSGVFGFVAVLLLVPVQTTLMKQLTVSLREVGKRGDARMKLVNEVLGGMRVIKYYAWELPFQRKLEGIRNEELDKLTTTQRIRALNIFFINLNPVLLATATFLAFALLRGNISPDQAFQASAVFQQLLWPLMMFPRAVSDYLEALISLRRLEDFLLSEAVDDVLLLDNVPMDRNGWPKGDVPYVHVLDAVPAIEIEHASFSWGASSNSPVTLSDVSLSVKRGSLVAVVGSTGSGKSSLISAILGDMSVVQGRAKLMGKVAYIPQQAWIFNATVRENIVFGLPFNPTLYNQAVDCSQLRTDIEKQFAGGDQCEIGEKGINLSGGQRQRINIARGVYSDADVYLFDDPLSALDAHVTAAVFRDCIKDRLSDKTIILATNQLHFMPKVDWIVVMKKGRICEQGTFNELNSRPNGELHRLYEDLGSASTDTSAAATTPIPTLVKADVEAPPKLLGDAPPRLLRKQSELRMIVKQTAESDTLEQKKKDVGKLVQTEGVSVGSVQTEVYKGYARAVGYSSFVAVVLLYVVGTVFQLSTSVWLSFWSSCVEPCEHTVIYFISIYIAISMGNVIVGLLSSVIGFTGALRASLVLYNQLAKALLRAPISFYDTTPLGRITNRFVDLGVIDNSIMTNFMLTLRAFVSLLGTVAIIGFTTPYALVPFVPLLAVFSALQRFYGSASVQLKRLESVSRSPVFAHLTESLVGMPTVRAYVAQSRLIATNTAKLEKFQMLYYLNMTANRWLSVRLEFIGGLLVLFVAANCVLLRRTISPGEAGLSLSYVMQVTAQLNMIVRFISLTEADFNSVERVLEYTNLESEADTTGPEQPPPKWPKSGEVAMKSLNVSYRPGLPPVLKDISIVIRPREKVGVCGRTGAGKSTLFQSLFRMMEASSGCIEFDGVNIAKLGLDYVRNAISIIPQEPVLFSGTLRFNLDPFNLYTNTQLWQALEKASLKSVVLQKGQGLDLLVSEGGENFSVGQRQLICLARALLRDTRILVLDEATANVDIETDALIQKTIRDNFADRTTLTIAHRLNTIIDCDKILVLNLGQVQEYDSPSKLLADPHSEFSSMVAETGEQFISAFVLSRRVTSKSVLLSDIKYPMQNSAFLRSVAFGDVALTSSVSTEALAEKARSRLSEDDYSLGPLMKDACVSADRVAVAFENRNTEPWVAEREACNVPLDVWLELLSQHLNRASDAAKRAVEEEHLSLGSGRHDDGRGMFADSLYA